MKHDTQPTEPDGAFATPPFLYEIRVKGRLSGDQWTAWFDDLSVSSRRGESTLTGRVPDHAALYGLLARLRDLAIPLVSVKVLDADAQRTLRVQSRRYDLLMTLLLTLLYLTLVGAMVAITVLIAPVIHTALALTLFFTVPGALGHLFWLWSGQRGWRWVAGFFWVAAGTTCLVLIPVSGVLPTPLALAVVLLIISAGLAYLIYHLRRRNDEVHQRVIPAAPTAEPNVWDRDADAER